MLEKKLLNFNFRIITTAAISVQVDYGDNYDNSLTKQQLIFINTNIYINININI